MGKSNKEYNAELDVTLLLHGLKADDIDLLDVLGWIGESGGKMREEMLEIVSEALRKYDYFRTNRLLEDELESHFG